MEKPGGHLSLDYYNDLRIFQASCLGGRMETFDGCDRLCRK